MNNNFNMTYFLVGDFCFMKKIFIVFIIVICFFVPGSVMALGNDDILLKGAVIGLLMEESTGTIIFEKEMHKEVAVASMTKMVAQIIILENIENGNISWGDIVTVSRNASDMGGSQIYLSSNEKMSVKDLFKGISMASANDATVAMAEYISGSEEKFVKLMNKKVRDLGLKNTVFKNCTGLDEDGHYSSAYDMAIIARELLSHKEIYNYSSVYEDYLRVDTPNKFWLVNTNKLVRLYDGADGLKTGHTDNAKYCLAATAKKNGMRLIAIVLGEDNANTRNDEAMSLLDYGFDNKSVKTLKTSNDVLGDIYFEKANFEKVSVYPKRDINILQDKGVNFKDYKTKLKINDISLPLKKGDIVGKIDVMDGKNIIFSQDVVINENIYKLNYFQLLLNSIKRLVSGDI